MASCPCNSWIVLCNAKKGSMKLHEHQEPTFIALCTKKPDDKAGGAFSLTPRLQPGDQKAIYFC